MLPGDAWEPLEKIINGRPVREILEQRGHGNPSATKTQAPLTRSGEGSTLELACQSLVNGYPNRWSPQGWFFESNKRLEVWYCQGPA